MFKYKFIFTTITLLVLLLAEFNFASAKSLVPDSIVNTAVPNEEILVEKETSEIIFQSNEKEFCPLGDCGKDGIRLAGLLGKKGISFSLIILAGLIDGINPCAIGMLILLLGFLLVFAKKPEKMLSIGLIYIGVIFVTYFLLGWAFSEMVYQLLAWPYYTKVSEAIKYTIVGLIILAGLVNLKNFFWYGRGFSLGIAKRHRPVLMRYIQKTSIPATVILGVLVTLFELPCSLPLYVGAIVMMTSLHSAWATLGYLLVYNLMFVLPLVAVFVILLFTEKVAIIKDWQERGNKWMKLSMGLAQILIGAGLLLI